MAMTLRQLGEHAEALAAALFMADQSTTEDMRLRHMEQAQQLSAEIDAHLNGRGEA